MELIAIAAVAVVAWFAAGTIWNVRLGRETLRWMQDGLPLLGKRTTVRWLGSSAVEMVIREGNAPFSSATLIVFLEPRDMPWMWALARIRGRADTLIIRGVLQHKPAVEFEALDPSSWSGRDALPRVPQGWTVQDVASSGLLIHYSGPAAFARGEEMYKFAQQGGLVVKRLSVRRSEPHFQVHVAIPDHRQPARAFFESIHALAERALP